MKLLIILLTVAYGYTDKLDRTYLPPANAGTAGGSPGALAAPPQSFGQEIPVVSGPFGQGSLSGAPKFGANNQESANGDQKGPGFGLSGFGQPSEPSGFGSINGGQGPSASQKSGFSSGIINFGQNSAKGAQNKPGPSGVGGQVNGFGSKGAVAPSFGPVSGAAYNGFGSPQAGISQPTGQLGGGSFNQAFGSGRPAAYEAPQPERPQAAADRNAEILKYVNENDGESYNFNYETSNGISAEESGVATDGVKAQGGFAYTGDDGYKYSVTYTADENGFQPQGEHLPTPPPIPAEILKSIEDNARAAAAGTQEGAYRPEEYESEGSPKQYNAEASRYDRPQSQNKAYPQSQGNNLIQGSQLPTNQGNLGKDRPSGFPSGQFGQVQPNQGLSQISSRPIGSQGPSGRFQQDFGNNNQGSQFADQGSTGKTFAQDGPAFGRGQGNGYQYNKPQTSNSSGATQSLGPSRNIASASLFGNRPESSFQDNQFGLSKSSSSPQRPNGQSGPSGSSGPFGSSGSVRGSGPSRPSGPPGPSGSSGSVGLSGASGPVGGFGPYVPSGSSGPSVPSGSSGSPGLFAPAGPFRPGGTLRQPGRDQQPLFGSNQPSFGANQPSREGLQSKPGQSNQLFKPSSSSEQGYQYGLNPNQRKLTTGNGITQGYQQLGNKPSDSNIGYSQGSQLAPSSHYRPGGVTGASGTFGLSETASQSRPSGPNEPSGTSGSPGSFGPGSSRPSGQNKQPSFGSNQSSFGPNQPSLQGIQPGPGQSKPSFGSTSYSEQGYQYGLNPNQPTFNTGNGIRQGSKPSGSFGKGSQQLGNKPTNSNIGSNQGPSFTSGGQNGPSISAGRPQYQQNGNQPSVGPITPSQGSQFTPSSQYGPGAPGSSGLRGSQPNQPAFGSPGSQPGKSSQANGSEFGGPRQPPSFNPQEGYKY